MEPDTRQKTMLNIPTFAKDDLWEDDCASDEEEDDRASVEDDVLGKLNVVETVVNNDIRKLKGT